MADETLIPAKAPKKRRGPGKPFQKGRSGNPNGRPRLPPEIRERAQHYGAEMVDVLRNLATDPEQTGAVRVSAAVAVLDRGFGKPVAPVVAATTEVSWAELVEASMTRRKEREEAAVLIEQAPDPLSPSNNDGTNR